MNQNHFAGGSPYIPGGMPSRRQAEYQHSFSPSNQPQSPMHPYAYPYPPYYSHPAQSHFPQHQPRWQPPHPQPYMPYPPPQSQPGPSPRPFMQQRMPSHMQIPQPPPQNQIAPSPRPTPQQHMQPLIHTPVAPPSPAPTPKQEQRPTVPEREATPPQETQPRRQSIPLTQQVAETRMPVYPSLPWHSQPLSSFPPRHARHRNRRWLQKVSDTEPVALPARDVAEDEAQQRSPDDAASETSTIAAPSEPETPATSQAPSESDYAQRSTPSTPAQTTTSPPKITPTQTQHARRDTRTAIAVPNLPAFNKPKQSPPAVGKQDAPTPPSNNATPTAEDQKPAAEGEEKVEEAADTPVTPVTPPPKPAPKSWADLVRRNAATSSAAIANGGAVMNGVALPKSASLADALKQYSVQIDETLSFLEPRGLVNTGNMCYMNSILQVLVFCVPFYNFLDQVRQRTVHSMKSDTPLVDAMIMFMKEFRVVASADSADILRSLLNQQQLEQYGEPVTPEYVYDAIRKLDRFNSMRRGHQQDAEEFFGFLLEGLHDECVAVMRGQTSDTPEENGVSSPSSVASPTAAEGWLEVGPKQKASVTRTAGQPDDAPSPITKIFGGHLRSELRVPGLKDSVTLEPYKPLQLDIGAPHVNNIVDALKGLTRTEALTGDFGGRSNSAKKQVFIDSLPPILILHLKRFQYENNLTGTQKIWKKVGYPLELEIPKEVIQPSKRAGLAVKGGLPRYRLTSVVYHHGKSAAGGHYTVDVLREDGREWIRMDDTVIRRIRPEDVAEGGAEEDPKLLAKALEQHKNDQDMQKQKNMYQGLDEAEKEPEEEKPWSEVNGHIPGHRKWSSVANTNGTATPVSTTGKRTPTAKKSGVRDDKVAYILLYERIRS